MDFNSLVPVNVANTRASGTKKQRYSGFKFRRNESKKGGAASVKGKFQVSHAMWKKYDLDNNGLKVFNDRDGTRDVFFVVCENRETGSFEPRLLRSTEGRNKGKAFASNALENDLSGNGLLGGDLDINFYFQVEEAQDDMENVPEGRIILRIIKDPDMPTGADPTVSVSKLSENEPTTQSESSPSVSDYPDDAQDTGTEEEEGGDEEQDDNF